MEMSYHFDAHSVYQLERLYYPRVLRNMADVFIMRMIHYEKHIGIKSYLYLLVIT